MAKKKKKKGNPLLILLFALVLLTAGYFGTVKFLEYSEEKAAQESQAEEEANTPYLNKTEEFVKMAYTNQRETLHFEMDQETEHWINTEVPDFPLSDDKVSTAVYGMEMLAGVRKLEAVTAEDLEEYGLVSPAYTVEAEDAEGNVFIMYVGEQNGTTGDYYAQVKGQETVVYTISSNVVNDLEKDLYDFIQMEKYPAITEDSLLTLEFTSHDGTIAMERQEESESSEAGSNETESESGAAEEETIQWQVTGEAAAEDLVSMAGQISFGSCKDYKVSEDTKAEYGLDSPAGVLTVTYTGNTAETEQVTLTIGGYDEEEDCYYCLMNDSLMVYLVSASVLSPVLPQ